MSVYRLFEPFAAGECVRDFPSEFQVGVVHGVEAYRTELRGVYAAVREYALVGAYVHYPARHVAALPVIREQLAFEGQRQFVDKGRVHMARARGVESGLRELVGFPVAGYDARIVAGAHGVRRSHAYRESLGVQDVLSGPVPFGNAYPYGVVGEDSAPGGVHRIRPALLVIGGYDKYRHRIEPAFRSEILSHGIRT